MIAIKEKNVITIEFEGHDTLESPMLYQYDKGQKIKFLDVPDGVEVQFSNENSETTDNRILADSQVEIPDFLISEGLEITAYIQYINDQSETTTKVLTIPIECRTKQQDIVPDEDKGAFRRQIEQIMNDTKKAAEEAADKVESNKEFLDKAEKAAEASENSAGKSKEYMDATDANRRTVEGLTEKNKEYATQTESNAESANTSASNASESASNASQSASNAASSATNASASATKAAASEKNAKASEENVKKSESNVNQAVTEFEQERADSIAEINKTTTNSKKEISDLTETKKTELNKINNDITNNASSLKEAIVNAADEKKEEINQKGLEVLQSIPEEFSKVEDTTLIKPTVQGTEINLTDSSDMNIQELHFFGKSEQKTTKGIQLLNLKDAKGGTGDGVTYTPNGDGSFKKTGTATGQIGNIWLKGGYYSDWENKTPIITLEVGKSYYIKDCAIFQGQTNIASGSRYTIINVTGEKYPEGIKITGIRNTGFTLNKTYNEVIYPIIAESSTAVDWEEYTGGQPSPNPDYPKEIASVENPTVTIQGKNLYSIFKNNPYEKEQLINGVTYTPNADGSVTIKGKATTTSRYNLISNSLSAKLFARHIDEQYTIKIFGLPSNCCYEVSFAGTRYGETKNTFTNVKENSKKRYTELRIPEGVAVSTTIYPMLVLGDTINGYEPYKQIQTVTFNHSLNGIDDVKDELIIRADGTGQLIQRLLEEELNDNSNYVLWYENTNTYGFLTKGSKWLYRANKTNIKSNKLKGITKEVGNPGTYDKNGIFVDTAGLYIKISKKYLTEYTVDALKTYLRDNPITVVGLLKEPIVTELSSEEVQKILAIHTNKPNTTIWNDQDAEMQVTYVADTKSYIDNKMAELQALLLEKGE